MVMHLNEINQREKRNAHNAVSDQLEREDEPQLTSTLNSLRCYKTHL